MKDAILEFSGEHRWLSNFWPSPLVYEGIEYPSVEHAYQAAKTLDPVLRKNIARAPTPGMAKREGRRLPKEAFRTDWESVKLEVMLELLYLKFQDPGLKTKLIATGSQRLIEGNGWHDQFWGRCACDRHRHQPGQNWLGKQLEQVRMTLVIEDII